MDFQDLVTRASLEQALQINRALEPLIRSLRSTRSLKAHADANRIQQILVTFLQSKDLEILCSQVLNLEDRDLRERCFVRIIQNSGILPLTAIAGM